MNRNSQIDFRSDTVTQPCDAMRRAMYDAPLGDDVYGDDPTVNRLEATAAELLGTQAALFCSSGTQTNLLALMSHCARGDEYIAGIDSHVYKYEGGGAAVLGSIQPQPIAMSADGSLDLAQVGACIKPDDFHFARTRLLCLENTYAGRVIGQDYIARARALADQHGLALHLDGARLPNAAIAQGIAPAAISQPFDSISLCLSKGLGAPVGSVLCASEAIIARARRLRKMLGGGMRQAGVLAAAGLYALEHNIARLQQDHDNAAYFAQLIQDDLQAASADAVRVQSVQTNMVFVMVDMRCFEALRAHLARGGVLLPADRSCYTHDSRDYALLRLVLHLDIERADIVKTIDLMHQYFQAQ